MGWVEVSEPYASPPRLPEGLALDTDTAADGADPDPDADPIDLYRSRIERADLSRLRIGSIRECLLVGCKLTGTDLAGAPVADTVFENCMFTYTNLRMARLERVRLEGCVLEEADAYEARLVDVDLGDSRLVSLDIDRVIGERVDLRRATELGLRAIGRLDGWLIGEHQLPAMIYALAASAGLDIERFEDP
ncbi:MAG: pentapeptide repeat-containing protein [Acidimicrobiia bacterium]|nr:pentapeptide repeat-containing protein [Acidimicrobiia bacterium]